MSFNSNQGKRPTDFWLAQDMLDLEVQRPTTMIYHLDRHLSTSTE